MLKDKSKIAIWYAFEIEPKITKCRDKIKKWFFIHNVTLFDKVEEVLERNNSDTFIYHTNKTILHYPILLNKGKPVMTPDGFGIIRRLIYDEMGEIRSAEVEMMTRGFHKSFGYYKVFKVDALQQLVVYHKPSMQYILVSPRDYVYFDNEEKEIEYRITIRKYATLSPSYRAQVEYIKYFNKERRGPRILSSLKANGYTIVKQ